MSTVLLADDDDELREALADLLELEGWSVLQARDGREAVGLAVRQPVAVVVLDYRMPRMNGAEAVRTMRQQGQAPPTILISAARDCVSLASELGLACWLGKPFAATELVSMVRRALTGAC